MDTGNATASDCPGPAELAAFAAGTLARKAFERVARHVERCRACEAALDGLDGEADALVELAEYHQASGTIPAALSHARDALALARTTGQRILEGQALNALAAAYQAGGEVDRAIETCRAALEIHLETGHRLGTVRAQRLLDESVRDRPSDL